MIDLNKPKYSLLFCLPIIFLIFYSHGAQAQEETQRFNVILIDITSLRADHLSCYGYGRNISPQIDKFAEESVIFTRAISQAHWTLPSVTSILTSLYVPGHTVDSRRKKFSGEISTLPAVLRRNGYRTLAFVGGLDLVKKYNLMKDFDFYIDDTRTLPMGSLEQGFSGALDWIRSNSHERFFIFIQGYDIHPPFSHNEGYKKLLGKDYQGVLSGKELNYQLLKNIRDFRFNMDGEEVVLTRDDIDYIIAAYDEGIARADKLFGDFIKSLQDSGKLNDTIIILFGDHGEELHDHGSFDRFGMKNYYDEVLRVPLFIRHPLLNHKIIDSQVELIDIMPTVLSFLDLNLKSSEILEGDDLRPLMNGEVHPGFKKYVFSGGMDGRYVIRMENWKLFLSDGKFRLYNLAEDPGETAVAQNDAIETEMAKTLYDWYLTTGSDRFIRKSEMKLPQNRLPLLYRKPGPAMWNR